MRRMRGAAVVVTAMAIGRTLVARVGLAFIRTILTPCFCLAGTLIVPAFHAFHLELNADSYGRRNNVQIYCHSAIASVTIVAHLLRLIRVNRRWNAKDCLNRN